MARALKFWRNFAFRFIITRTETSSWCHRRNAASRWSWQTRIRRRRRSSRWLKIVSKITRWQYQRTIKQCRKQLSKPSDDNCPSLVPRSTGGKSCRIPSARSWKRNNNEFLYYDSLCGAMLLTSCRSSVTTTLWARKMRQKRKEKSKFAWGKSYQSCNRFHSNQILPFSMIINIQSAFFWYLF